MSSRFDKLLVLDLDETLIYATMFALDRDFEFQVGLACAYKRPGVDRFLATCLEWFRVGIWTSATQPYADDVVSHLFPDPSCIRDVAFRRNSATHDLEAC